MLFLLFLYGTEMHCDVGFRSLVSGPPFLSFLFHVGEGEAEAGSSGDITGLFFSFFSSSPWD